jgi:hypothetical protein
MSLRLFITEHVNWQHQHASAWMVAGVLLLGVWVGNEIDKPLARKSWQYHCTWQLLPCYSMK